MIIFMLQQLSIHTNMHYVVTTLKPKVLKGNIGVAFTTVKDSNVKVQYHVLLHESILSQYKDLQKYLTEKLELKNKQTVALNVVMFSSNIVGKVPDEVERIAKEVISLMKLNKKKNLQNL